MIRAGAGGAGGAFGVLAFAGYPADGCRKIQLRQTGRRCRTLAAYAQAFIQLHGPINAGDALTGQTTAQGASSQW